MRRDVDIGGSGSVWVNSGGGSGGERGRGEWGDRLGIVGGGRKCTDMYVCKKVGVMLECLQTVTCVCIQKQKNMKDSIID